MGSNAGTHRSLYADVYAGATAAATQPNIVVITDPLQLKHMRMSLVANVLHAMWLAQVAKAFWGSGSKKESTDGK